MSTAAIAIIGDEILRGDIQDENGPWLIEQLSELGIDVQSQMILPDNPERAIPPLKQLLDHNHVFVTGGIGPTHDDRTRKIVASLLERDQSPHDQVLAWLRDYYGDRLNSSRRNMANLPTTSDPIHLDGTPAIGFQCENIYVLPGIPKLMKPLFNQWAQKLEGRDQYSESITVRRSEGKLADTLETIQNQHDACSIGSYPVDQNRVRLKISGTNSNAVTQAFDHVKDAFA